MSRFCSVLVLVGLASGATAHADPRAEMAAAMESQADVRPAPVTLPAPARGAPFAPQGQPAKRPADPHAAAESSAHAIVGQIHALAAAQQVARQAQAAAATAAGQVQAQAAKERAAAHPHPSPRH
jgi:hypothetical protein